MADLDLPQSQLGNNRQLTQSDESDVRGIKQALINERAAPELLMYQEDLIGRLQSLIGHQEGVIEHLQRLGQASELMRSLFLQEVNRVKYMLRAYLRCRLLKIETYVMYILDNEEEQEKLSQQELHHAQEFFILFGRHMKTSVLRHLPPEFNQLAKQSSASEGRDMIPEPNLGSHVFCQVLEDCGTVELDDQGLETADFERNDLYVVRYQIILQKLREKSVQLI